jgi:DNA polymerase kappa
VFERELDAIGVKTCGDIYAHRKWLRALFGDKAFDFQMRIYLGLGRTDVRPAEEFERKSVGTESTFHDMSDPKELREKLRWIAEELEKDLERTQFKGKTLVLKVKLHSYEVYTRQFQPPKAVHKADDLYHFGLQMFQKLEKEIPNLTLRLMGLRCTHLVSTKKGELDFFGRARNPAGGPRENTDESKTPKIELDDDGWQKWPDDEFEDAARQERQDDMDELERLSQQQEQDDANDGNADNDEERKAFEARKHDNGFAWRLLLEEERAKAEEEERAKKPPLEQWDCPICGHPQTAEEKSFNEHIDGCLSRQTIKEIVQTADESPASRLLSPAPLSGSKKRGRPRGGAGQGQSQAEPKKPKKAFFA